MKDLGIAVIGLGDWGPNHIRIFSALPAVRVVGVADPVPERQDYIRRNWEGLTICDTLTQVLELDGVDAVVVSTPTRTHHALTKQALLAGKDVLVEKPITYTPQEASELVALADNERRALMVGHVFVYNDAVRLLKNYIDSGELGEIHYLSSTRTNLGPIRRDVNAMFDLGSHDISLFSYILDRVPKAVSARGAAFIQPDVEDVAFMTLDYPGHVMAHAHLSWLNPRKERTLTIVGSKKMVIWNDMDTLEPIRLYDKGLTDKPYYDSFGQFQLLLRDADILIPKVAQREPLRNQAEEFVRCIRDRSTPLTSARWSAHIVRTLWGAQHSMRSGGILQTVA